ncbi:MAG: helix-turn-helix domain-containing protein [Ruminococcaceae bacterium]|nr:helix-turn-helix domain-containing protein [Oscillospiraceae bacterium]
MNIKNFVLSYYENSAENFHIQKIDKVTEAQKPHTHEYFQIYFISKGSLEHHIENESAHLNQGDMFIIPPGVAHYIVPSPNTVFYSLSFMEELFDKQYTNNKLTKYFLRFLQTNKIEYIKPKITINSGEIFYIESIMAHILKEFDEKPFAYHDTVQASTHLLVTMLAREYFSKTVHNITDHFENNKQFILHCVEYIENNFADKITLDDISKISAISKSNFCALFLKITGHSFNNYLNICRIKAATSYIKKGYKITAIYGLCGYNDFSTFNRNFNKLMGMSPREYKKQLYLN